MTNFVKKEEISQEPFVTLRMFLTPEMDIRNLKWFQLVVTDHICNAEKDWGQLLHPSLNNNMSTLVLDTFLMGSWLVGR